jgi:RND family efflux transporter MFP subunit
LVQFQLNTGMSSRFQLYICLVAFTKLVNAAPSVVKTQPLAELLIERKFTSPATAIAINQSQISAELTARITHIEVRVGDVVETGGVLVKLDCRNYDNALASAEAQLQSFEVQLNLAQQQLKRVKTLQKAGNMSVDILDQRVAEVNIAGSHLKARSVAIADARLSIQRCLIRSPYRAEITKRLVGEGTLATPGLPLLEIVGLDNVELSAQIPVNLSESVLNAKSLSFVTKRGRLKASIRHLSLVINAASGNRELRFTTNQALTPGTSGRLEWYSEPLLPASLLTRREQALGVFVVDASSDRLVARFVELKAALEGRPAPIDLPATTQVIVEGRHQLSAGDEIKLVNDD